MSDQYGFTLRYLGLHDEERKKINVRDALISAQRRSVRLSLFMMMVHPYQADKKYKHNIMTFRARVKPLLDVDGIDASIDIQMMKNLTLL